MRIKKIKDIIDTAAQQLELRPTCVARWLKKLGERELISNEELNRLTGLPKPHLGKLLNKLSPILEPPTRRVSVKESCINDVLSVVEGMLTEDVLGVKEKINAKLSHYDNLRNRNKRKLDQFKATKETVGNRVAKMIKEGDIQSRRIVLLGDNDLTSIGIGLVRKAKRITVLDIDKDVLRTIEAISQNEDLEIEVVQHDLRDPLPSEIKHQFDTVFTDPPYTLQGVGTFINQAIELIKQRFDARIYLCYGNSDRARERELPIQQSITERGLLIHSKLFQFNSYQGARSIGSRSSLFLLDWTPQTKTFPSQGKRFYTYE